MTLPGRPGEILYPVACRMGGFLELKGERVEFRIESFPRFILVVAPSTARIVLCRASTLEFLEIRSESRLLSGRERPALRCEPGTTE